MRRPGHNGASSPAPGETTAERVFRYALRVYYQDTDAGGVVFHAAYLNYFERARTEWLRDLGFGIGDLVRDAGVLFIVREIHVKYHKPALLDDKLIVTTGIEHLGRAQFTLEQRVLREQEVIVQGRVNLGCVTATELKPARVPPDIRAALERSQGWPITEEEEA
ncbi:MAG: tol-pal system-associated acyl-CoA thioesterase [Proteobacteria bacterium]|nr:MAG: tol-pal system-associated acyl-CoA thioesterase [Pseudomonadota bacterium]